MWLYSLLPAAGVQVQSAALGGSAITPQTAFVGSNKTVLSVTVELSGSVSTVSAGTPVGNLSYALNANSPLVAFINFLPGNLGVQADDSTALFGSSSTVSAGSVLVPRTFALSGTASTTGAGTVVANNRPTTITTTALVPAAGTLVFFQLGDPVTINLNAGEMEMLAEAGSVIPALGLTGSAITSAAGSVTVSNLPTATLQGQEIISSKGIVGIQSDVEDTFIQSSSGVMAFVEAYALTGIGMTAFDGTLTPSGDLELALTGEEDVFAAGSFADFSNEFVLTGQEILVQQDDGGFGLPEEITLSGIEIVSAAGTVYLNNDRDYPLVGEQTLVQDGITFASSLAFLSNLLITTEQEQIGPIATELTGQQIDTGQYQFVLGKDTGAGHAKKPKKRKKVTIDGQTFECDEDELKDLVRVVEEVATAKAKEEAEALLLAAKADKTVEKIRLKAPKVSGSEELKDKLADIYAQAAIDAQVALEVSRNRQLDEEEAIVLLLVN